MINLIGLYGPSRSGKDSVAGFLVQDYGFEQRAMADRIREILLGLDPLIQDNKGTVFTMQHLLEAHNDDWGQVKAASRESVDYMIRLGQTCRAVLNDRVWLDSVLPSVDSDAKVVISDVRQPNEYQAIKERGGLVWKISRPGVEYRGMDGLLERYDFDAHLDNRGSLVDLRGVVMATLVSHMNAPTAKGTGYGR